MRTITQTQISAYERCKRSYYLQYIRELAWPVEKSPRKEMERGADFHLLVRQLIMGFPESALLMPSDDEKIRAWMERFQQNHVLRGYEQIFAEKEATALFSGVLWLGKFDALALMQDRITVYDWKTTGHRGDEADYLRSPQTRLYRFLAMTCAPRLLGGGMHRIPAENIEMVYWFPEHPDEPVRLPYSEDAWQEDMTYLRLKARELCSEDETDYPCTADGRRCRFCSFETYCFPDKAAADLPDASAEDPQTELPPGEVFQTDLFSWEPPQESEQGETSF